MAKTISLALAYESARSEMGRDIRPQGFEERVIGPHVINIFYYSCEYAELGTLYRADVYENGRKSAGLSFG